MIKFLLCGCVAFVLTGGCTSNTETVLDLNNKVNKEIIEKSETIMLRIQPTSLTPGYRYVANGITYDYTIDSDLRIDFLDVHGKYFIVPEGFTAKSSYKDVNKLSIGPGRMITGLGYVVPLKSGWNAFFYDSAIIKNQQVNDSSLVTSFYKIRNTSLR